MEENGQLAQETVEPELMVTLRPKGGMRMIVQPRQTPVMPPSKQADAYTSNMS
jgi:hypothetical protein